ncbi:hypothetical protein HanIR_Chr07g0328781 [Helianthus annuus]|nr:hypothetical protein HanIR_Chr07g0328781 [Helianthus annuus]
MQQNAALLLLPFTVTVEKHIDEIFHNSSLYVLTTLTTKMEGQRHKDITILKNAALLLLPLPNLVTCDVF